MVLQYRNFTIFCKMQEPRANLDSFDFLPSDLGQGRSLPSLGGIAVGILAIGVFLQQYNYRYSAIQHGLSNLEYEYLINDVADSKKRKNGNGNRNRKRKIDNSGGYGLFSSASNNGLRSLFSVLNFEICPI